MSLLTILEFPHPNLRIKAKPITVFDEKLQRLIDDMFETMYNAPGIGLAATQVDVHQQLFVMDVSESHNTPQVLINACFTFFDDERQMLQEGCLSVPDYYAEVPRALHIHVKGQDRQGNTLEFDAYDLMAHCIQHEIDHLQGKLFIDYLSPLKRERILKKMQKRHKQTH